MEETMIGQMSDSHNASKEVIAMVMKEFRRWGVGTVIHNGNIMLEHVNADLFGNFPVYCALSEEDPANYEEYQRMKPENWTFTYPGIKNRIITIGGHSIYIGHKKTSKVSLREPYWELLRRFEEVRDAKSNVRWITAGHQHRQRLFHDSLMSLVIPGTIEINTGNIGGYEFVIFNMETGEIIFSRIFEEAPTKESLKVGVIADSRDVSEMKPSLWKKVAQKFREENVTHVIHCGNIDLRDVGRPELSDFKVKYCLRKDQFEFNIPNPNDPPKNWEMISKENPVVNICGYNFLVSYNLGHFLFNEGGYNVYSKMQNVLNKYQDLHFILGGSNAAPFFDEGEKVNILMPGGMGCFRRIAIIDLPRYEIYFGRIS